MVGQLRLNDPESTAATGARARDPSSKAYHAKDEGARLSIENARCWRISLAGARRARAMLLLF